MSGILDDVRNTLDHLYGVVKRETSGATRYGNEMFRLRCAGDLLGSGMFPNYKEWTESAGAFSAAQRWLMEGPLANDRGVRVLAVGDGVSPRAGAMFAMRSAWDVHSVDPLMRTSGTYRLPDGREIRRLTCHPKRVEDLCLPPVEWAIVVAVHSHAPLPESVRAANARCVSVVAIPCCTPLVLPCEPDREYADFGIVSPERTVRVWNWSLSEVLLSPPEAALRGPASPPPWTSPRTPPADPSPAIGGDAVSLHGTSLPSRRSGAALITPAPPPAGHSEEGGSSLSPSPETGRGRP